jgi:flagellar FliL protein
MATTTAKLKPADTEGGEGGQAPKKKKGKLVMIIIIVLVLVLGGVGYLKFFKKKGPPPAPKPGAVVTLDPITINLAGGHFLKLGLALQVTAAVKEAPDGSKALDLAVNELSNRSITELSSNKSRNAIKEDLKEKVVKAYDDEVMDIYFTQFVMQ